MTIPDHLTVKLEHPGNPISLYYILQPLTVFGAIGVHLVSVTRLVVPDTDIVQGHPQGHSMEEQSV